MGGNNLVKLSLYFLISIYSLSCSAFGDWKKYSFNPRWAIFANYGSVSIKNTNEVTPLRSGLFGNPIESIKIKLPLDDIDKVFPASVTIFAKNGWNDKSRLEFDLKGIYRYAKENPKNVFCQNDLLCKVEYSLIPLINQHGAVSYFDYMLTDAPDTFAYLNSKFLKSNSWDSLPISEVFFVECRSSGRCIRMNMLGDYMYIYDLYLPADQWVLIDQRVNDFLAQNVRVQ